jgi:hypothetical protein
LPPCSDIYLLGDQRGGSEWEPIKILLLRENSTYTPNSQLWIPTRVCQGHVVTMVLPTLGTNPKRFKCRSTKQEAKDLAVLQEPWRTVHGPGVDGPRSPCGRSATHDGLSVKYEQNDPTGTSTRGWSVPHPRTVREQLVPRGQSATSGRTVRQTPSGQQQLANRIKTKALKNTRRTRRTPGRTTPRGQSARTPRTVRQAREQQHEPETSTTKAPTRPFISQTAEALEERFGDDVKRP